ncbi:hypothetical protein ABW20_dc0101219 [Dactylellina cionopaga]|nr:hypothetical protein ABW20_dc0101219 [Dactylellina cionopaga]
MDTCKTLDYACMCQTQADVLQCYDQCPNDVNRSTEQSKLTAYCVAASAVVTPTSTLATYSVQTSAAVTQSDAETTPSPSDSPSDSPSSTDEESTPSSTKSSKGGATSTGAADSSAARITWMCASSLLAILTAAFMAL